ncbi:Hypothetical Protein FCC1311_109352 [Hondaea fermentalgiana]|uniref:AP2/ERF domain-containing protein n=1 Tax=Hondaea fermentalgiana TaxID=2315210 RepID=A0A2R5H0X1_9STRA|nr:Hypothetical Protein FCC1311_109352 [Hondaea fermentalgiana]|eukprot:GBG34713.1 Hypothetical Protein FCC1311_109352 [Hondaea fermentalgiana]
MLSRLEPVLPKIQARTAPLPRHTLSCSITSNSTNTGNNNRTNSNNKHKRSISIRSLLLEANPMGNLWPSMGQVGGLHGMPALLPSEMLMLAAQVLAENERRQAAALARAKGLSQGTQNSVTGNPNGESPSLNRNSRQEDGLGTGPASAAGGPPFGEQRVQSATFSQANMPGWSPAQSLALAQRVLAGHGMTGLSGDPHMLGVYASGSDGGNSSPAAMMHAQQQQQQFQRQMADASLGGMDMNTPSPPFGGVAGMPFMFGQGSGLPAFAHDPRHSAMAHQGLNSSQAQSMQGGKKTGASSGAKRRASAQKRDKANGRGREDRTGASSTGMSEEQSLSAADAAHTSKYRGVYWNKTCKAWRARIWAHKKSEHLGNFEDEAEAARAFDKRALELGRFNTLNFPESHPHIAHVLQLHLVPAKTSSAHDAGADGDGKKKDKEESLLLGESGREKDKEHSRLSSQISAKEKASDGRHQPLTDPAAAPLASRDMNDVGLPSSTNSEKDHMDEDEDEEDDHVDSELGAGAIKLGKMFSDASKPASMAVDPALANWGSQSANVNESLVSPAVLAGSTSRSASASSLSSSSSPVRSAPSSFASKRAREGHESPGGSGSGGGSGTRTKKRLNTSAS